MGANRTSFLANRRLQPLGHLSAVFHQQSSMCLVGSCRPVGGHALQQLHRRVQALQEHLIGKSDVHQSSFCTHRVLDCESRRLSWGPRKAARFTSTSGSIPSS